MLSKSYTSSATVLQSGQLKPIFFPLSTLAPKLVVRKQGQALRFLLHKIQAMQGLISVLALESLSLERMTSDCSKHHYGFLPS